MENAEIVPKPAASVILLREAKGEVEIYLLRRHRKASFMSSSFVFPGGIAEDEDGGDLRTTAVRELFEEAGILLTREATSESERQEARNKLNSGDLSLPDVPGASGLELSALQYFAKWITPSIERRRYEATFFMAALPPGQTPSPDNRETVDEIWVSPAEAIERCAELRLPPPQLRTLWELSQLPAASIESYLAYARSFQESACALLPRSLTGSSEITLLLPWDPDYEGKGYGDALSLSAEHPLAFGPSRFVMQEDRSWRYCQAAKRRADTP